VKKSRNRRTAKGTLASKQALTLEHGLTETNGGGSRGSQDQGGRKTRLWESWQNLRDRGKPQKIPDGPNLTAMANFGHGEEGAGRCRFETRRHRGEHLLLSDGGVESQVWWRRGPWITWGLPEPGKVSRRGGVHQDEAPPSPATERERGRVVNFNSKKIDRILGINGDQTWELASRDWEKDEHLSEK